MNKFTGDLLRFNKHFALKTSENAIIASFYSTKPAVKRDDGEELREKIVQTERVSQLFRKPRVKKPQKPPFAKNLFIGKFDTDILTYPQLEKDELETLEGNLKPIGEFLKGKRNERFTKDLAKNLSDLCLLGLRVPVSSGGRELTLTETCKFNEIIAGCDFGRVLMCNEQFGVQALLKNGSEMLKAKYLPRLLSGELLSALCINEEGSVDPKFINTKAVRNPDGTWVCIFFLIRFLFILNCFYCYVDIKRP